MDDLPTTLEGLRAALLQARTEVTQARREVVELSSTIDAQRGTITKQEQTILELLAALRGKQRERIDPDQLLLFEIGELETLLEEQASDPSPRRKRRGHGRRLLPDNLPREEVLHELPEEERLCPHDGRPMQPIRYEISEQPDYEPAKLKVLVHKRAVYACPAKHDEATLLTAPKPPQPIDKGLPGPGLLAALVLGKFGDHLPGYRLEDILFRHGVQIRRSTIYDWLAAAANLAKPLVDLMRREVLQSKVIHTDDTQVKLIDSSLRGTRLARYWAYVGDTAWTESHQKTGRTDLPLNERGEEHARQIGAELSRFSFSHVFTSPLQRASRTCELAGFGHIAEFDQDLLEWDYGRFEGKQTGEILEQWPGWELFRDGCPEGESPADVAGRADRFIARVHKVTGDVLAFSSGHFIRMIAARWFGLPAVAGRLFYCDPASVGVLGFEHSNLEEPVIRLWNYATFPRE